MASNPSSVQIRLDRSALTNALADRFGSEISSVPAGYGYGLAISAAKADVLPPLCRFLFRDCSCSFAGIVAEELSEKWQLHYAFLAPGVGWIDVVLALRIGAGTVPSIVTEIHAADWHEREIEDMFGICFENHPRLGDFILHDQIWREGIAPMRKRFDVNQPPLERKVDLEWEPRLVVGDPGSFAMPVGPVYDGGLGEPLHFLLETVGEDVIRAVPRLFYKYRAMEKIAEGRKVEDVLLLAERFAATSAFAHSLAFCQAVERSGEVEIPQRATQLRVFIGELERLRHHAGAIGDICTSTALSVSAAHASIIEEELLRASCLFACHRYLFGLNVPGGLSRDFEEEQCRTLLSAIDKAAKDLRVLENRLRYSSSFLDRLEDVGVVTEESARDLNLVGPIGRASAQTFDLRKACPYSGYQNYDFEIPSETEGDGYARLRVLFAEAAQSARLIHQAVDGLVQGAVRVPCQGIRSGVALGWAEAPRGAALHWIKINAGGLLERYHAITPSFTNWLGFHVAAENFAFQDFPIILATFGLSATECDR
jgi:Ni,Fe-hydrogenase III large subunit/Ni,Fe-hydrogenase III component G